MGGKNNFIVVTNISFLGKISLVLRKYIKVNLPSLDKNFIMKTYILLNFTLSYLKDLSKYRKCMITCCL